MTVDEIKKVAWNLGYEFDDRDCAEIIATSFDGETAEQAVKDFIDAYEGGNYE